MKRLLLAVLLLPSVALAHDDAPLCPICRCSLTDRDPVWAVRHDLWWNTYHAIQFQIVEYSRCYGYLNALEAVLQKPISQPDRVVLDYEQNIQHPIEDEANNVEFVTVELEAARITFGQFLGEVYLCSAKVESLKLEAAKRVKLKKEKR